MRRTLATLMRLLTVALGAFAQDAGVVASYDAEQGRTFVPNPPAMGPFPACDTVLNYGTIPAYPAGVFGHGSATLGDTLYIVGGSSTGAASNVFARYHIPSGTWAPAGVFPESKTGGDLLMEEDAARRRTAHGEDPGTGTA